MHLYFAFGSNLHAPQLLQRCPSAALVSTAALRDHHLVFAGESRLWGGGVASIRPRAGAVTRGAVYRLTAADLCALDRCEGHPLWYRRTQVPVATEHGREVAAWTYALPADVPLRAPTDAYLARIAEGYAALGLEPGALHAAASSASQAGPDRPLAAVFVYGSLLAGLGNHHVLQRHRAALAGLATTAEARFQMWSLGAFPAVSRGGRQRIQGEVYRVGTEGLRALDRLEGHPEFYRRELLPVVLCDRVESAWAYLRPASQRRGPLVSDGDWRAFRHHFNHQRRRA